MIFDYVLPSTFDSFDVAAAFGSFEFYINVIFSFVLLGLGGLFIWLYYGQKNDKELMEKYGHKSAGSFKGYWARYRGAIYSFLAAMFIFFGILVFLWCFGIIGDITYDAI